MIKAILKEYGLAWVINRSLYSLKLKMLNVLPFTERFFERKVVVSRIDIFDFDVQRISAFIKAVPVFEVQNLIQTADKACNGILLGFSSIQLDYGNPIDWHFNPLNHTSCRADLKWYKIPDFDEKRGDIKLIWEASRFTHFLTFARAYLLTDKSKYYEAFSVQLADWLEANSYPYGPNYKCGQECSLRMINVLIAYSIFYKSGLTSKSDEEHVFELVLRCYKKIRSNFFYANKCIKNNHTLSELTGLIIGAWCCKDDKQMRKAYRRLDKEVLQQFSIDGGYKQFSFNYQRFALQIFECIYKLSSKTGTTLSKSSWGILTKSTLLMYQCQVENGDLPNYGSNDGALIFPLTNCGYRDFRPVINSLHALITGKRLYSEGLHDEELLWFGAGDYETRYKDRKTSSFPAAGLFTLRDQDSFLMVCLNDYQSRPGHMDQLHMDLWYKDINILCDSGTYSYASDLGKQLSSTDGHNTVKIRDKEQMTLHGQFMMYDWTERSQHVHSSDSFKGTAKSKNGYQHTRSINKIENGWLVLDSVEGSDTYSILLHTPCQAVIENGVVCLLHKNKKIASLESEGEMLISDCKRSLFYMKAETITCVEICVRTQNNTLKILVERDFII